MKSLPKAFTFIELLIVVIIIGVLVGLAVPNFRSTFSSAQADSFSRQLQSYMNYLRDKSVVEQKVIYLDINTEKKEYSAWMQGAAEPFKTYTFSQDISVEISKKSNAESPEIYFYPDGRIDKMDLTVTAGNNNIVLTTEGVFGKVKINKK